MSRKQWGHGYHRGVEEGKKQGRMDPYRIASLKQKLEEKTQEELLELLEIYALRLCDGHYSLLRFTSGWRCCLGTIKEKEGQLSSLGTGPNMFDATSSMPFGRDMKEAIINCLVDAERRGEGYLGG